MIFFDIDLEGRHGQSSQENIEDKQEPELQKGQRNGKRRPWSQEEKLLNLEGPHGQCSQENEEDKQEPELQKGQRKGKKRPWSQQENKLLRDKFPLYFKNIVNVIHKHDLELVIPLLNGPRTVAQIRTKLNNMKLGKSK